VAVIAVVTTTLAPSPAILELARTGVPVIVVGDASTPRDWNVSGAPNVEYVSPERQASASASEAGRAALGGLLTLTFSDTRLLNRTKWQLHSIESVYGQPLPLGSRFGIRFKRDAAGPVMHLHCTSFETTDPVTKESSKTGAICFQTDGTTSHVNASRWHVPSACFAQVPLVWEQP
jgi:hypothetical protein